MTRTLIPPRDSVRVGYLLDALLDRVRDDAAQVIEVFDAFPRDGVVINNVIATRVIAAYGKLGRLDDADRLIDTLGRLADAKTFGALVSIHAKVGDVGQVEHLLGRMAELGLRIDERLCGSRVMAHAKAAVPQLDTAVRLFDAMRADSLKPHLSVCNALITACSKVASTSRAQHVLDCMIQDGTAPNSVTLAALLQTCFVADQPLAATDVLARCVRVGVLHEGLGHEADGSRDQLWLEPQRILRSRMDMWRTDYALEALGWAIAHFHLRHGKLKPSTRIEGRARARDAAVAVRQRAT